MFSRWRRARRSRPGHIAREGMHRSGGRHRVRSSGESGKAGLGAQRLESIAREMLKQGVRDDLPVALVRWATTGRQETLTGTLQNIAQRVAGVGFEAPAVAVFGEVVALRESLNWYEKRPLSGKRIVVTRTRRQASALSDRLRALGADVIELPTIRIEPPSNLREFAELVQDGHAYDWILFTSPNGVTAFF